MSGDAPLAGIRVLEIAEGLAAPWCGMQLADAGAEVVKVEPAGGDFARGLGPPFLGGVSTLFLALNRGKRSILLDDLPAATLEKLVRRADVLLHDRPAAWLTAQGLDPATLAERCPGLVVCAVSAFGAEGPWRDRRGDDLVAQAAAEYTASLGQLGAPPVRLGADVAAAAAAFSAFQAILVALIARTRDGRARQVSTSLFGALMHLRGILWASRADPDEWYGFHLDSYVKPPDHGYRTADQSIYFSLGRGSSEDWDRLLAELEMFDALNDPRFADNGREAVGIGRWAHEVKHVWEAAFAGRTAAAIVDLVRAVHGNAVPLMTYEDLAADPQVAELGAFFDVPHPEGGTFRTVAPPWRLSETPVQPGGRPPRPGEHTQGVLSDWLERGD